MALLNYEGTVTKVELKKFDHPDPYVGRYSPFTEHCIYKLLVAMQSDNDGEEFWFYSPAAESWITCPPGAGFAVYGVHENDWIDEQESEGQNCRGGSPVAKVLVGERLAIRARVKRENTRYGTQLYYVKRESAQFDAVCACGKPYRGKRGQCDECTEHADLEETRLETAHGM